jgi:2-iminobutanoate/2-iminopropanoate deaminase
MAGPARPVYEDGARGMPKRIVHSERAPAPVAAYSQAVAAGKLLFLSGQIPIDPATGELVTGGIDAQARRVLDNLAAVLEAASGSLADVVKVTVYLVDMNDFSAFNATYVSYFPREPPARATLAVAALSRGARLEIEAVALLP